MNQKRITLVSLGIEQDQLPVEIIDRLHSADAIYTRSPHTSFLQGYSVTDIRDRITDKNGMQVCVDEMIKTTHSGNVVYVNEGDATRMDYFGSALKRAAERNGVDIEQFTSNGFTDTLLDFIPVELNGNVTILDALKITGAHMPEFSPSNTAVLLWVDSSECAKLLKSVLSNVYPQDHRLWLVTRSSKGEWKKNEVSLGEFGNNIEDVFRVVIIPPLSDDSSFESFQELVAHLRAPEGCPWDREQTHASLRGNLLEETYEVLTALDQSDWIGLREELGDLMLQILLHTQIAVENGEFTMPQLIHTIHSKLIRRHPHVFAQVEVEGIGGILRNWEDIKAQERKMNGDVHKGLLDGVPQTYPALAQAQDIQARAARVGFDWQDYEPVLAKVKEELDELSHAENAERRVAELGDLLFAVVNVSRWLGIEAESALRMTNARFRQRFRYIEQKARETNSNLKDMTLAEMDVLWEQAKELEAD